jgi:hypothetical protein
MLFISFKQVYDPRERQYKFVIEYVIHMELAKLIKIYSKYGTHSTFFIFLCLVHFLFRLV